MNDREQMLYLHKLIAIILAGIYVCLLAIMVMLGIAVFLR